MKKFYFLSILFIAALITGCSNEELINEADDFVNDTPSGMVIKVTAGVPDGETRFAAEATETGITFKWEENDVIYFLFDGGTTKGTAEVTLTADDLLNGGKQAKFEVEVPAGLGDTYNVYAIQGGQGFDGYNLKLPQRAASNDVNELAGLGRIMTQMKVEGVQKGEDITGTFKHLGSIFRVVLNNTSGTALDDIAVKLVAETPIAAHMGGTYNPITGEFSNTIGELDFGVEGTTATEGINEFWGWYVPADTPWPALGMRFKDDLYSSNAKAARTAAVPVGRAISLYATYNGTELLFTNKEGVADEGLFIDSRDHVVYRKVTIGTQTWMAENLAYLPAIGADAGMVVAGVANTVTDPAVAKQHENYTKFGVYYNRDTATGGNYSAAVPSGIQGVCPDGWHMPSDAEFKVLTEFTGGGTKLKSVGSEYWPAANDGTDEYGFDMRGAGYANGGTFNLLNTQFGYVMLTNSGTAVRRARFGTDNTVQYGTNALSNYWNVRCVKD